MVKVFLQGCGRGSEVANSLKNLPGVEDAVWKGDCIIVKPGLQAVAETVRGKLTSSGFKLCGFTSNPQIELTFRPEIENK